MASKRRPPWPALAVGAAALLFALWWSRPSQKDESAQPETPAPSRTLPVAATASAAKGPPPPSQQSGPSPKRAAPTLVLKARWGSGNEELGRRLADESNPEAPMALAAAGNEVLILDHVNGRVQVWRAGRVVSTFTVADTAQDLARTADGRTLVLDRLGSGSVAIYGTDGSLTGELSLAGPGLESPGDVSGVFVDDGGIYVERAHGSLVRIGDREGQAVQERSELPGRPTKDQRSVLSAAILDQGRGLVAVTCFDRETLVPRWSARISLDAMVLRILLLDSDPSGHTYLVAETAVEGADLRVDDVAIIAVKLDPEGREVGRLRLPSSTGGEEMLRPIALDDDGRLLLLEPASDGAQVSRWAF